MLSREFTQLPRSKSAFNRARHHHLSPYQQKARLGQEILPPTPEARRRQHNIPWGTQDDPT